MDQPSVINRFLQKLGASLNDGTFVRLILSRPASAPDGPDKVLGRLVELKGRRCLSLTFRHATRDVTRNLPVNEATTWTGAQLVGTFRTALLGTTRRDWQLTGSRLVGHKPAATRVPSRAHDQPKTAILDDSAWDWLHGLGVVDAAGQVRAALADKYRQINRYLEILSHLSADCGWSRVPETRTLKPAPLVADMGCGKGYLTFGVWHLFRRVWQQPVRVIGVETRPDLVAITNQLAKRIDAAGLEFVTGTIASVSLPAVDALIALHACDTATDDAIRRAVHAGAKLIIVAPCCHKEVRRQLGRPAPLAPVLEHGIMAERLAEWATDGLRALYLESVGYRTKLIEFIGTEHTPKNLMIAGIRTGKPAGREDLDNFRTFFGIQHQALDSTRVERASRPFR